MITTRMIVAEVAQHYALPPERVVSKERTQAVHLPRRMSWALARCLTQHSIADIGRRIGEFNHATVLHGLHRLEAQMLSDRQIAHDHQRLLVTLRLRETDETTVRYDDPTALAIATALLAGSIATTEPTVRELRTLCEATVKSAARIAELETADVLHALQMSAKLKSKSAELDASTVIVSAARRVANTARTLAADAHTPRERASRIQHEAALNALQNHFERV